MSVGDNHMSGTLQLLLANPKSMESGYRTTAVARRIYLEAAIVDSRVTTKMVLDCAVREFMR
jgi:hypothetical protein